MDKQYRSKLIGVREIRSVALSIDSGEQRGEGDTAEFMFRGCASTTDMAYRVADALGEYKETVAAGAFKTTLAEDPEVAFLIEHQGLPLASTRGGTMKLWESERGLEVEATLDPTNPMSRQVISGIMRGDISEMSYSFRAVKQEWDEEYTERLLRAVNIHRGDVSVVTYGANPHTKIDREHIVDDEDEDEGGYDGHDTEEEILTLMQYTI